MISDYNTSATGNTIEANQNKKYLSYVIATYDVIYPNSFPAKEYGISHPALRFQITGSDGKAALAIGGKIYTNLNQTFEIGEEPTGYDFYPGDTYHGAILYQMVKGYTGYLIQQIPAEHEKNKKIYIRPGRNDGATFDAKKQD